MKQTTHLLIGTLLLGGCTLATAPEPPVIPVATAPVASDTFTPPYCPLDRVEVTLLPRETGIRPITKPIVTTGKKALKPQTPAQLVSHAQQAARVEPSAQGYGQASGEQVYAWAPGKVYTVYLSKKQGTGIFLPPGERLISGLYLDADAYEVKTERAGADIGAYDALTVRPLADTGEVDAFLLTESGRRYLLHFVVGTTGMLAVTFEAPAALAQTRIAAEPALILPRPTQ